MIKYLRDSFFRFTQYQASSGIILIFVTLLAIIFANSGLSSAYFHLLHLPITFGVGEFILKFSFEHFVNDALMAIFFLLVSLEIKRELVDGHLSEKSQQILPVAGAIGGILIPSLIYAFYNWNYTMFDIPTLKGWAIPAATDIAFAVGIISIFGKRLPVSLKVFLTALAIIDDLAAIIIIAFFYSKKLSIAYLAASLLVISIMILMNKRKVCKVSPYLVLGILLWALILKSGIHATIAGVVIGLMIPMYHTDKKRKSPLERLEHSLSPWVGFLILPIFAFCNAGISLGNVSLNTIITNNVSLGILMALFFGKQIGVFLSAYLVIKLKYAKMPDQSCWTQLYGVAILTGIGFTMSIFIGNLAFTGEPEIINYARVGILAASFLSAVIGYIVLTIKCPKNAEKKA